jgi:hypothetical protein
MQHEEFEHQHVASTMENERFELQNVVNTVEMEASSSKMLQIARKTGRKADPPPKNKTEKTNSQNNSGPNKSPMIHRLSAADYRDFGPYHHIHHIT